MLECRDKKEEWYMSIDYNFLIELFEGVGSELTTANIVVNLLSYALCIAGYCLRSIGLYSIAKRRGIANAWLAWIPVAWVWVLGSISDQFRYITKAQVKNKRITLLVLRLIKAVAAAGLFVLMTLGFVDMIGAGMYGTEEEFLRQMLPFVFKMLGCALVVGGINLAYLIIHYIAMYDLYVSCNPGTTVVFLVLSIVFKVTEPFFVFFSRKKDCGMPPRCDVPQDPVACVVPEQVPIPAAEEESGDEEPVAEEAPDEESEEETQEPVSEE